MPIPFTQECRFRVLVGLVSRQKISNEEKWDLFDKHVQKHLKFQEGVKLQAFKLFWKSIAKPWRQFRVQLM
jgi:hypothetical protein